MDDSPFNWARQTRVSLESINNEEQYPTGTDSRALVWTLSFKFETWVSLPMEIRRDIVKKINVTLGNPDGYGIDEYDENGELRPFDPGAEYGGFQLQVPGELTPDEIGLHRIEPNTGFFNASLEDDCPVQPPSKG